MYVGVRNAAAMSNGTVALHLALHALGVQSGDEVIVLDLTFAATAHAVLHAGASPALVDIDHTCILWWMDGINLPSGCALKPEDVERAARALEERFR